MQSIIINHLLGLILLPIFFIILTLFRVTEGLGVDNIEVLMPTKGSFSFLLSFSSLLAGGGLGMYS